MVSDKLPSKIYLQVGDDVEPGAIDWRNDEITWCVDQINASDVPYVLASKHDQLKQLVQRFMKSAREIRSSSNYDEYWDRMNSEVLALAAALEGIKS